MKGVTFHAWREGHEVSLHELMRVLERFEARLETIAPEERLTTPELLRLVTPDVQLIDGTLLGYGGPGQEPPSHVLRAVDGTSWDVESMDEDVLARVRRAWPDAHDLPA